jgi:hypothetical protein
MEGTTTIHLIVDQFIQHAIESFALYHLICASILHLTRVSKETRPGTEIGRSLRIIIGYRLVQIFATKLSTVCDIRASMHCSEQKYEYFNFYVYTYKPFLTYS